ncbi:MAG TPA: AI-2E family transporter [Thermoanaerobaculia bacterium]|nr:AI-2E family transporter [Thermoanaerobaculia bacterium]
MPPTSPSTPEGDLQRPDPRDRAPGWRSFDVLRAAALVFGLYFTLRLFWLAHPLFLTAFLGLLFGLAVARGADFLKRLHVPRGLGAALLVFGTYALLYGVFAISGPTLSRQFGELRAKLPEAVEQGERFLAEHRDGLLGEVLSNATGAAAPAAPAAAQTPPPPTPAAAAKATKAPKAAAAAAPTSTPVQPQRTAAPAGARPPAEASQLRSALAHQLGAVGRYLFPFLSSTLEVLAGLLLITFIAIYIGAEPDVYRTGFLALVPLAARPRADEVLLAISTALRKWLLTQFIAMLSIGLIWGIALSLLRVKAALSLAVIAGLLEFIPTVGPILAAVPAIAMGFLDSPEKALLVFFVYTAVQMVEGHLLIPILMKEGVDIPPVLTLLAQALLSLVFGFLGLVVAVPLLAMLLVAIKKLYVEKVNGGSPTPARARKAGGSPG